MEPSILICSMYFSIVASSKCVCNIKLEPPHVQGTRTIKNIIFSTIFMYKSVFERQIIDPS